VRLPSAQFLAIASVIAIFKFLFPVARCARLNQDNFKVPDPALRNAATRRLSQAPQPSGTIFAH
jgi:hypothetical protein